MACNKNSNVERKEEEFRLLNDELEAKTLKLFEKADEILKKQEDLFSDKELSSDSANWEDEHSAKNILTDDQTSGNLRLYDDKSIETFDFEKILANIEGNDIVSQPECVTTTGDNAQIRILKSKVRVMHEEIEKIAEEIAHKHEELKTAKNQIKQLNDENERVQKQSTAYQQQLTKYKSMADQSKTTIDKLQSQISSTSKDLEASQHAGRTQQSNLKTLQIRFNRMAEDFDKCKEQLQQYRNISKDVSSEHKQHLTDVVAENNMLKKQQKNILAAYSKQICLIDNLKKQKSLIEAAKTVNFLEEKLSKILEK